VVVQTRSMRSLRWSLGLTRWLLYALVAVGVLADIRFALLPPAPRMLVRVVQDVNDSGGQWFADEFARAYLSWGPDPAARERALAPYLGPSADPNLGVRPTPGATQVVESAQVASRRQVGDDTVGYTVAVLTSTDGLIYLEVDVTRVGSNRYALTHFPAIVAAPSVGRAGELDAAELPVVTNGALRSVLDRALKNYLIGSVQDLDADLANGALVTPPSLPLTLEQVWRLAVEPSGAIIATVLAQDRNGTTYTLSYTVGAVRRSGRWEISMIAPSGT
jgi:hypothetical protein